MACLVGSPSGPERRAPNRYNPWPGRARRGANYGVASIIMNLVLYYAPVACSLVPYVTLTEAGAQFEVRPVNMGKRQQMSADYLKVNPKHKVPVLVVDGE